MLNDFLPAIISFGILIGFFLFAWISDVRRIQPHNGPEFVRTKVSSEIESASIESLPVATD